MPTTMPAMVPAGVPPPLKGATVTVANDVATVTVVDDDDCDVMIPDDAAVVENAVDELVLLPVLSVVVAEDFVVAEALLILK